MPAAERRPEYSEVAPSRHGGSVVRSSSRRLRVTYFGIASLWGFVVGIGGVLAALQADGAMTSRPGLESLAYITPAIAIAIGGAFVIAGAYQEAKRRRR